MKKTTKPRTLLHVDEALWVKYQKEFGAEVAVQQELSLLLNQYMFDRLETRSNRLKAKEENNDQMD